MAQSKSLEATFDRQPLGSTAGPVSTRVLSSDGRTSPNEVRRWRAFPLLVAAYFMTIVDLTITNVALPTIGVKLHFPEADLQWVVTAYGLSFGGFLLLGGRAADLLGRRRLLMIGLAIFTAASLACGLAASDTFLIIMRGIQGFGAAVVLPAALSIVMNMFPEGAERNKALGIWGAMGAMGATVGCLAGGLLTRYVGWESIFFLNVPIGVVALGLAPQSGTREPTPWRKSPLRRGRSDLYHRCLGPLGLCRLRGAPDRLGSDAHGGHALVCRRPAGHVLRHRVASGGTAVADAAVPFEHRGWFQRGRLPLGGELLLLHLRGNPLHAAGAWLLGAQDGPRLVGRFGHLGGFCRTLPDVGH